MRTFLTWILLSCASVAIARSPLFYSPRNRSDQQHLMLSVSGAAPGFNVSYGFHYFFFHRPKDVKFWTLDGDGFASSYREYLPGWGFDIFGFAVEPLSKNETWMLQTGVRLNSFQWRSYKDYYKHQWKYWLRERLDLSLHYNFVPGSQNDFAGAALWMVVPMPAKISKLAAYRMVPRIYAQYNYGLHGSLPHYLTPFQFGLEFSFRIATWSI